MMIAIIAFISALPILGAFMMQLAPDRRPVHAVMAVMCLSSITLPRVLYGSSSVDSVRVGVTGAEPRIMTYTVGLLLVVVLMLNAGERNFGIKPILPLILFVAVWPALFWNVTSEVQAGLVHLLHGALAWVAGWAMGRRVAGLERGGRIVLGWLLAWAIFQAAVCSLQFLGFDIFAPTGIVIEDASLVGRAGGTLGHPSTIGKAVFVVMLAVLPFMSSKDVTTRRLAFVTIGIAAVPSILSGGRANAAALIGAVVLWVVMDRGVSRWARRALLFVGVSVAIIASLPLWVERFRTGENGAFRARFNATAVDYLQANGWWTGSGANTYVSAVGPTDSMAAVGWIVHNLFLLYLVEIGAVGLFCLLLPWLYSIRVGWRARGSEGVSGGAARALIAWVPGGLLITMTGFGMAADPLIPWYFFLAMAAALARAGSSQPAPTRTYGRAVRA